MELACKFLRDLDDEFAVEPPLKIVRRAEIIAMLPPSVKEWYEKAINEQVQQFFEKAIEQIHGATSSISVLSYATHNPDGIRAALVQNFKSSCQKAKEFRELRESKDFVAASRKFFNVASSHPGEIADSLFDELIANLPPGMEDTLALIYCERAIENTKAWRKNFPDAKKNFEKFCSWAKSLAKFESAEPMDLAVQFLHGVEEVFTAEQRAEIVAMFPLLAEKPPYVEIINDVLRNIEHFPQYRQKAALDLALGDINRCKLDNEPKVIQALTNLFKNEEWAVEIASWAKHDMLVFSEDLQRNIETELKQRQADREQKGVERVQGVSPGGGDILSRAALASAARTVADASASVSSVQSIKVTKTSLASSGAVAQHLAPVAQARPRRLSY